MRTAETTTRTKSTIQRLALSRIIAAMLIAGTVGAAYAQQPTISLGWVDAEILTREGQTAQARLRATTTSSTAPSQSFNVSVESSDQGWTATSGADYAPVNQTVTFNPSDFQVYGGAYSAEKRVALRTHSDNVVELEERYSVSYHDSTLPSHVTVDNVAILHAIRDATPDPIVTVATLPRINEGNDALTVISVNRDVEYDWSMTLTTSDGSAVGGPGTRQGGPGTDTPIIAHDYDKQNRIETFSLGTRRREIRYSTASDTLIEGDQTFDVTVEGVSLNSRFQVNGRTQTTVTIVDDDHPIWSIAGNPPNGEDVNEFGGTWHLTVSSGTHATWEKDLYAGFGRGRSPHAAPRWRPGQPQTDDRPRRGTLTGCPRLAPAVRRDQRHGTRRRSLRRRLLERSARRARDRRLRWRRPDGTCRSPPADVSLRAKSSVSH